MAKANLGDVVGGWAFLIGVVLAVIVGIFPIMSTTAAMTTLVIVGLIVGFLNVGDRETTQFLFSGLVLVLVSGTGQAMLASVPMVGDILRALLAVFVPATVIVAVKNVLSLARR